MLKALLRTPIGCRLIGWLLAATIGVLMRTVSWRRDEREAFSACFVQDENSGGVIIAFWHERLAAMPYLWPPEHQGYALQSPHADGQMMSHVIRWFGIKTIWGSSNRLAHSGLRGLLRVLKGGASVAITPDGPRGPARQAAMGPVALAKLSGRPIIPVMWSVDRAWRARGWDRTIFPKPFSRGRLLVGEPIYVAESVIKPDARPDPKPGQKDSPATQALEQARCQMEAALNGLAARADDLAGMTDVISDTLGQQPGQKPDQKPD